MSKHFLRTWIALLAAMILCLSCALGETAETAEASEPVLLVTVNGEEITDANADLQELVNYYSSYYSSYGYDPTEASLQTIFKATGLDWAIESALYRQKAEKLGITELSADEMAKLEADGKAEWEEAVAGIEQEMSNLTEESTEEEIAQARVNTLAYIESQYGYTEESYIQEYVDGYVQTELRKKISAAEIGEITVSEQEIVDHFHELVEADRETYEGNVFMYEYYTNYMGETSYYIPEGYRGITHILLEVDPELMNTYTDLSARFEEQQAAATQESTDAAKPAETAETAAEETTEEAAGEAAGTTEGAAVENAEAVEEAVEETTEVVETVTQEMVDAAKQAILDSVQPQIDEIMNKFNAGTPFADLIAEYGTDPGMEVEPNKSQGYMVHADSVLWDPAFISGAMTLEKVGDVSEPVLGSSGVHILFYLRDVPAGAVDMTEEIRNTLHDELLAEKEADANSAMVDRWIAEADIQYTEVGKQLKADAEAAMAAQEAEEDDAEALEISLDEEGGDELEVEIEDTADSETGTADGAAETEAGK